MKLVLLRVLVLLAGCLLMSACVHETGLREQFEKNTKDYNRMLRWQEMHRAVAMYADPASRDDFMARADQIRTRGVTITDYRLLTSECFPDKKSGEVVAEFDYYILPSNRIKSLTYRQEWFLEGESQPGWKVRTPLPPFE